MIFVATLLLLLASILLNDNGRFTSKVANILASTLALIIGGVILSIEFGLLRGIFTLIGLFSLVGTLYTLLQSKINFETN